MVVPTVLAITARRSWRRCSASCRAEFDFSTIAMTVLLVLFVFGSGMHSCRIVRRDQSAHNTVERFRGCCCGIERCPDLQGNSREQGRDFPLVAIAREDAAPQSR